MLLRSSRPLQGRSSLLRQYQYASSSTKKSWVPTNELDLQKVTTNAWIHEVAEQQRAQATRVVPWFLRNMPASYFKSVSTSLQSQHVQAITTVKEFMNGGESMSLKMVTPHKEGGVCHISFIHSATQKGLLNSQITNLSPPSEGYELSNVNVFSSLDNTLALNIFTFVHASEVSSQAAANSEPYAQRIVDYIEEVRSGKYADDSTVPQYSEELFGDAAMAAYLKLCTPSYVQRSNPRRFLIQKTMYDQVRGTDGTSVHIEPYLSITSDASWVSIASANVLPDVLLRLCSGIISAKGFNIQRAHLDSVAATDSSITSLSGNVTMLRLLVDGDVNLNTSSDLTRTTLLLDLKRCKWLDNETTDLGLKKHPELGLNKAEVITALVSMLHGPLHFESPRSFPSIKSIIQVLEGHQSHIDVAGSIAQMFLDRFNPHIQPSDPPIDFKALTASISSRIKLVQSDTAVLVLHKMLKGVNSILRTNFYRDDRYALSLRLDPSIMSTGDIGTSPSHPLPFGIFFVHGRNFNAFHNRFRDIARGGLRIVTPSNSDQYALESTRQFNEVYGLSYAQQLKNKDIPEGGAKGVILVNTPNIEPKARFFAMRKAVKAFSDSMLDLIVKDSVAQLVDYYNKDELIYFGPDEQIIPQDIDWIVARAAVRGYPLPAAFMSSKQANGFNHKEFGVTSEGVVVYVDVALRRSLHIDPHRDAFSVKITGGPDGDVAGNLIRILFREYGSNCKIVGIADGFGVAEDPHGLDQEELLRLVEHSLPISFFDASKLSEAGVSLLTSTEEGLTRRNTMHCRVKSDVFVPAGGRPNTINRDNWRDFLDEHNVPSSKLIVEGANIFITPEARQKLYETAKVAIVKDSSANKCGVITSSCEVQACMLLSKEEFLSIKPALVADVLVLLRSLARLEGELLFREYNNYHGSLPHFSERISFAIAKVRDAVSDALTHVLPTDALFLELQPLIREGLPKKLVEVAGDRIASSFPVQYQRNAIASALASKLVYKEGIHLVEAQPVDHLAQRAFQYYRKEKEIRELLRQLEGEDGSAQGRLDTLSDGDKSVIVDILRRGGVRASLSIF